MQCGRCRIRSRSLRISTQEPGDISRLLFASIFAAPVRLTTTGIKVAVKDRLHGARNPLAHLQMPEISMQEVEESPMLWDPIRFLESCPSSDGACAMVICDESLVGDSPKKPHGFAAVPCAASPRCMPVVKR